MSLWFSSLSSPSSPSSLSSLSFSSSEEEIIWSSEEEGEERGGEEECEEIEEGGKGLGEKVVLTCCQLLISCEKSCPGVVFSEVGVV